MQRLDRPQSLVVQVEQALRRAIAERSFPDDRLPTEVELAESFGVSRETVRRAAEVLQREGLLTKYRRRGTIVRPAPPEIRWPKSPTGTVIAYLQAHYEADKVAESVTTGMETLMLQGATEAAAAHQVDVVVSAVSPDRLRGTLERLANELGIRGAVLTSFAEDKALKKLGGKTLPLVLLDHDLTVPKVSSIRDDSAAGGRMAVEHLVSLGHRRIGYVHWRMGELNPWRLRGYRQGMRDAGLPVRRALEWQAFITRDGAQAVADEVLRLESPPTALVCFNNSLAHYLWEAFEARGVRVPERISLVGCGGAEVLGLTTCQNDWRLLGSRAVSLLLRAMEPPASETPASPRPPASTTGEAPLVAESGLVHLQIAPDFHSGRTTAPPPCEPA